MYDCVLTVCSAGCHLHVVSAEATSGYKEKVYSGPLFKVSVMVAESRQQPLRQMITESMVRTICFGSAPWLCVQTARLQCVALPMSVNTKKNNPPQAGTL